MTSPSADWITALELMALPLVIVSPVTPVLSRMARPVPVCSRVPRFVNVALFPVMVPAFVPPPTVSDPVSVIVPVCPAPEPRVCAVVDGPVILKFAADAPDSAKRAKAAKAPVWMTRFFIGGMGPKGDEERWHPSRRTESTDGAYDDGRI